MFWSIPSLSTRQGLSGNCPVQKGDFWAQKWHIFGSWEFWLPILVPAHVVHWAPYVPVMPVETPPPSSGPTCSPLSSLGCSTHPSVRQQPLTEWFCHPGQHLLASDQNKRMPPQTLHPARTVERRFCHPFWPYLPENTTAVCPNPLLYRRHIWFGVSCLGLPFGIFRVLLMRPNEMKKKQ